MKIKEVVKNIKHIYKNKNYKILAVAVFIISITLLLWLSRLDTLFTPGMNSGTFIFFTLFFTFLLAALFAINVSLMVYNYKQARQMSGGKSAIGSFLGMFGGMAGSGCPVCGSALLSFLGVAGGLSVFPFKGLELKALGVALLGFSTVSLSKSAACCTLKTSIRTSKFSSFSKEVFSSKMTENLLAVGLVLAGILIIFNQVQISTISGSFDSLVGTATGKAIFLGGSGGGADLKGVDVSAVSSTAMAVATVFPELQNMRNEDDIVNFMIPTGTPEYSEAMGGITFDDPVRSMEYLARWYYSLKEEVKNNDPQTWQRYLNLAAAPRGISCEFCCGVGPQGITKDGQLRCGCKHNPAVQAVALGLMKNTDYSDAQILREVMKWKTMFFPKNMVGLAMQVAGTDPSQLKDLPGMVGGC